MQPSDGFVRADPLLSQESEMPGMPPKEMLQEGWASENEVNLK